MRFVALFPAIVVAACAQPPGDFCDVLPEPLRFHAPTAGAIVQSDRPMAERIAVLNSYGARHCRGWAD